MTKQSKKIGVGQTRRALETRELFQTMHKCFSKGALIEIVADLVRAEIGEDADDEAVLVLIDVKSSPVLHKRGDRRRNLRVEYQKVRDWFRRVDQTLRRVAEPAEGER